MMIASCESFRAWMMAPRKIRSAATVLRREALERLQPTKKRKWERTENRKV